jgi:hypothetical protein
MAGVLCFCNISLLQALLLSFECPKERSKEKGTTNDNTTRLWTQLCSAYLLL